ncbi:MAG TPA: hypothetical protein VL418_14880 [Devosiaceae bacterium]|nr:hypothetical protein [Devosiaceae bacterium]
MQTLQLRRRFARAVVLAIAGVAALAGFSGPAAAQYYPPLQFYNNGLSIHVPYVRIFPGFPPHPGQPVYPGYPVQNCFLDPQVRILLQQAGYDDISFYGYANLRAHARAVRGGQVYDVTVHRCTHELLSAVPVGQFWLR